MHHGTAPINLSRASGLRLCSVMVQVAIDSMGIAEFTWGVSLKWVADHCIYTEHINAGEAWQNSTNESFHDTLLRPECLSMAWFRSRDEAKGPIETWRSHYNQVRLHSSLRCLTWREFNNLSATGRDGVILQ